MKDRPMSDTPAQPDTGDRLAKVIARSGLCSRRDAEVWDLRVATLGAEQAAQRSPEDGKRSPVEIY